MLVGILHKYTFYIDKTCWKYLICTISLLYVLYTLALRVVRVQWLHVFNPECEYPGC